MAVVGSLGWVFCCFIEIDIGIVNFIQNKLSKKVIQKKLYTNKWRKKYFPEVLFKFIYPKIVLSEEKFIVTSHGNNHRYKGNNADTHSFLL